MLSAGQDGYEAYDTRSDRLYVLNAGAALVVELCDGERSVDQMQGVLEPALGTAGWNDCVSWIAMALRDGLLLEGAVAETGEHRVSAAAASDFAQALLDRDRVLPALVCQRYAAELDPENAQQWSRLGELAHINGRRAEARAAYERYIALHPDDAEIAHILVSLRDEAPPPRASDPCIKQLYARFAGFYDENMSQDLEYLAPARLSEAVEPLLQGRSGLDVLDLGCGTGLCGQRLRRVARRLVGVDLSAPMIAQAQARGVYDALDAAEITAWLDRSLTPQFDVITACDSLIYFGDLQQVLEPAARRLAPRGLLAFTLERGNRAPFQLTDSGRFTHRSDHVRSAALAAGLARIS